LRVLLKGGEELRTGAERQAGVLLRQMQQALVDEADPAVERMYLGVAGVGLDDDAAGGKGSAN